MSGYGTRKLSMTESIELTAQLPATIAGMRLDQALAEVFPDFSRARLQEWLKAGRVRMNGEVVTRGKDKVWGGEQVAVNAELEVQGSWEGQDIPLNIVHEDEHILIINKPVGLVVHPGSGNPDGTLVNALLHRHPDLANLPRAGIVHRLDKDTTGLLVVARTLQAHSNLVEQLQARAFLREYESVVNGLITAGGSVDAPIGRNASDRKLMGVVMDGKPAVTHYRVVERFRVHTWLRLRLETGRTHQIRVHMSHIHHPLVGDIAYGGRVRLPKAATQNVVDALRGFRRQALHAARLGLTHPGSGEFMEWAAPIPDDMNALLEALREDTARAESA